MNFFEVIEKRFSVREFEEREVEDEKIAKILKVVERCPTAGNLQSYEIIIVKEEETKKKLSEAALFQGFIREAPVVLVFCANEKRSSSRYGERGKFYSLNDAIIATAYAQLAATALGLGSCWVGAFDDEEVSRILNLPSYVKPVAILPVGYPREKHIKTPRERIENFIHKEEFKQE